MYHTVDPVIEYTIIVENEVEERINKGELNLYFTLAKEKHTSREEKLIIPHMDNYEDICLREYGHLKEDWMSKSLNERRLLFHESRVEHYEKICNENGWSEENEEPITTIISPHEHYTPQLVAERQLRYHRMKTEEWEEAIEAEQSKSRCEELVAKCDDLYNNIMKTINEKLAALDE